MHDILVIILNVFITAGLADERPDLGVPVDVETLAAIDFTVLPNGD